MVYVYMLWPAEYIINLHIIGGVKQTLTLEGLIPACQTYIATTASAQVHTLTAIYFINKKSQLATDCVIAIVLNSVQHKGAKFQCNLPYTVARERINC